MFFITSWEDEKYAFSHQNSQTSIEVRSGKALLFLLQIQSSISCMSVFWDFDWLRIVLLPPTKLWQTTVSS